ncbi:Zn-dependent hydrolase, glyoxylase [Thioalkalivibrio nitratireducens DSM 14787]|uniref:Zn-dependent hydrolase, glyoxylase n=1 Tax=Thioalkalivibrio nitratireducens (strain DSM 14787 / UNIQEM 213 / ALEN2) TaxID=1255043 RepID=L0DUS8_THIND|nr:MBL fold metallo-hydrolase [Thioalkalivibrio nitratireducens]AGA33349.1 Zn-dependent hydrolase, glyoxylase [Thioalkalivibrio nitratireducens DSM 14787]
MKQIQPDLWETEVECPVPGLTTHAYLLIRDDGNVLFYNTGHQHEIDRMAELGGVAYQFLSHRDELGDTLRLIRERFGARLGGHVLEQSEFARVCAPDILFDKREMYLGDIEVIPTPGHTPGSTCFLVRSAQGKRYLFTGDTLYLSGEGVWEAGFISGYSDRETLVESLRLLQKMEPDSVLSSALAGSSGFQET